MKNKKLMLWYCNLQQLPGWSHRSCIETYVIVDRHLSGHSFYKQLPGHCTLIRIKQYMNMKPRLSSDTFYKQLPGQPMVILVRGLNFSCGSLSTRVASSVQKIYENIMDIKQPSLPSYVLQTTTPTTTLICL